MTIPVFPVPEERRWSELRNRRCHLRHRELEKRKEEHPVRAQPLLYPKERSDSLSAAPGTTSIILYRFDKVALIKDQVLKVYVYDTGGQRHLVLTLSHRDINKARRK